MQQRISPYVSSAAARPNGIGRCERGWADHAWVEGSERAELGTGEGELKGTQKRWMGRRGEGQVFMVVEEKRRGPAARAFPDRATAKPGGADRTTEITKSRRFFTISSTLNYFKHIVNY
jgi:hypothetical protein